MPSVFAAASDASIAVSRAARVSSVSARRYSASALRRRPCARHAAAAAPRSRSLTGAGHRSRIAGSDAVPASTQPASRSGIAEVGTRIDTARMNDRSSDTVAAAKTELTTPAKSTQKPATAIASVASQVDRDASDPRQTSTAPAAIRASCDRTRSSSSPENSTSKMSANDPNPAKSATVGFPISSMPTANIAGTTTAPRAARRSAMNPGSRARIHATTPLTSARARPSAPPRCAPRAATAP